MMGAFQTDMSRTLTPDRRQVLLASLASALTGASIYLLVMYVALPALLPRLTPAQVEWLREVYTVRPLVVVGIIVAFAGLLAVPVFGVFRWVYGPLFGRRE